MTIRVAINGFGRIGRNVVRALFESGRTDIEVVAINDLAPLATNKHLLKYDSVHGTFPFDVETVDEDTIIVGGKHIDVVQERDPASLPWAKMNIDIAAKAVGKVLPELNGKLDGVSMRVPTPNVSVVDFKFTASKATTAEEVNKAIVGAANGPLNGVLGTYDEPLVSGDFNHNPLSSIFAVNETKVIDGTLVRVMSWYDNEWGFSNRMLDTAAKMHSVGY